MSRPTRKRKSFEDYLGQNPDIDEPEMVEDNEDDENVENLVDSDDDGGDYVPGSPDFQVLEEDADDDDGDDPVSPKMGH